MSGSGRKKKKKRERAPYIKNRDLALRAMGPNGFEAVKKIAGDRLDARRATKIVKLLTDEYGYSRDEIPDELLELADSMRPGHTGGPVTTPEDGEWRTYDTGSNIRIGVPLKILGRGKHEKQRVKFSEKGIWIPR